MALLHQFSDVVLRTDVDLRNVSGEAGFRIETTGGEVLGTIEPQGTGIWRYQRHLFKTGTRRLSTEYLVRDATGNVLAILAVRTSRSLREMLSFGLIGGVEVMLADRKIVARVRSSGAFTYTVRNGGGELVSSLTMGDPPGRVAFLKRVDSSARSNLWDWHATSPSGDRQAELDKGIPGPGGRSVIDTGVYRSDQRTPVLTEQRSYRIRFFGPMPLIVWYGVLGAVVEDAH
jgi:hypothetical protein